MKYYKDSENKVYAYNGLQTPREDLIEMTPGEIDSHLHPHPSPKSYKTFTPLQVLDLFTEEEQLSIVTATQSIPAVKLWYDRLIAATFVTYEDERTGAGIQALADAELLSSERATEITNELKEKE